eukprot:7231891-Prymnesium_polylepis.1
MPAARRTRDRGTVSHAIKQSSNQATKQNSNQAIKRSSDQAIKRSSNACSAPHARSRRRSERKPSRMEKSHLRCRSAPKRMKTCRI